MLSQVSQLVVYGCRFVLQTYRLKSTVTSNPQKMKKHISQNVQLSILLWLCTNHLLKLQNKLLDLKKKCITHSFSKPQNIKIVFQNTVKHRKCVYSSHSKYRILMFQKCMGLFNSFWILCCRYKQMWNDAHLFSAITSGLCIYTSWVAAEEILPFYLILILPSEGRWSTKPYCQSSQP